MPIKGTETQIFEYPMPAAGVNLNRAYTDMLPIEAIITQNMVWKNGLVKREGAAAWAAPEVLNGSKVVGLHRFYYSGNAVTLAAAGTGIYKWDGTNWTAITTGQTSGLQTHFTTWLNSVYISNGTDALKKWDGTTFSTVAAAPANIIMTLPYQDRLLAATTTGHLDWSGSYSDATFEGVANTGVQVFSTPMYGMAAHTYNNQSAGPQSQVLLAADDGVYVFSGSDLRTPSTTGDYTLYRLTDIGCSAPRTMVWTPKGTFWMGTDRQVYWLPFEASSPIPVGDKIRAARVGSEGIESIPVARIPLASAAYNDGFYKLAFSPNGGSQNTRQFWLDVTRLTQEPDKTFGPWFGPMVGQSISCFASMNGGTDNGQLLGGSDNAAASYVYELDSDSNYSDSGTAITCYWQSMYNAIGDPSFAKDVHRAEVELLTVDGTLKVGWEDITGTLKDRATITISGNATYWDDLYWDEFYWESSAPSRIQITVSPAIQPRRLSMTLEFTNGTERFEIYALRVEAVEQSLVFAGSAI